MKCIWQVTLLGFLLLGTSNNAANAQTPTAVPSSTSFGGSESQSGYMGDEKSAIQMLNQFWGETFEGAGRSYRSPRVTRVNTRTLSGCNAVMYPWDENAYYCSVDETVYLFPDFMESNRDDIGDYAPLTIFGHEWGHHVQWLLGVPFSDSKSYELQADCLSGVFMAHAEERKLLDEGDFFEAITMHHDIGDDVLGLPTDNPGAHGTAEERVKALVKGYGGGPEKCEIPLRDVGGPVGTETATYTAEEPPKTPTPPILEGPIGTARLPVEVPLDHASCFFVVDEGTLTFSQLLERFSGFPDASSRLQTWGWQQSAFKQFGCNGPPDGEAGWINISVHGFSSTVSAQEAADYFAAARLDGTSLRRADGPGIGDYSVALIGPASNGTEFTIYATRGPWLVRVTGVSPSGIPFMNVRTVAIDVLEAQDMDGVTSAPPAADAPSSAPTLSSEAYLPSSPSLNYADCFRTHSSGTISYGDVRGAFARSSAGAGAVDTYGWRDGAWVVFACDDPPHGHARQLDVIIHQFRDASAARQVSSAVKAFQIPGDHESRACDTAGPLVICVTGYADTGSPLSDVHFVLNQVVASAR